MNRPTAAMPCTDPRDVTRLEEAFDLSTTEIQPWELELVWKAETLGLIALSGHAWRAAKDDSIPAAAIWRVVRDGMRRSKDVTTEGGRRIGINFEGKRRGGGWIRAKISWKDEYTVATVHQL